MFHKDSMKIARDFITGEMSVNKNEYADSASERASERGCKKERNGSKRTPVKSLSFYSPAARSSSWIFRHRLSMIAGDSKVRFRVGRVNFVV